MKYRSRYGERPPVKRFRKEHDLPKCALFALNAREPWGYKFLPSNYGAPLLGTGKRNTKDRFSELCGSPYYLKLAEKQPHVLENNLIYQLGPAGVAKLENAGIDAATPDRQLAHELLCCTIAASFEIGAKQQGFSIKRAPRHDIKAHPDWPPFFFNDHTIFIEADRGTKQMHKRKDPRQSSVEEQFEQYVDAIPKLKNPLFLFFFTHRGRIKEASGIVRALCREKPHALKHFGFTFIEFELGEGEVPPPTDWALRAEYLCPAQNDMMSFIGD